MKTLFSVFVILCSAACGTRTADGTDIFGQTLNRGFSITSFETVYGDGYTFGTSYSHRLHYDRASGTVTLTKFAYKVDPTEISTSLTSLKKEQLDKALDTIDTTQVRDIYLTDDSSRASDTDGLSMVIRLFGGDNVKKTIIDTFEPEKDPQASLCCSIPVRMRAVGIKVLRASLWRVVRKACKKASYS